MEVHKLNKGSWHFVSVDRAPRSMHQNPPANAGAVRDAGSISALGRPPGIGNGNPLQYSCLQNPMQRSLAAIVRGVTKSQTPLSMRALNANEEHFDLMDGFGRVALNHRKEHSTGWAKAACPKFVSSLRRSLDLRQ